MASDFNYQPLSDVQIRLLRVHRLKGAVTNSATGNLEDKIHCEISHHSLDQCPKYTALSYTWGTGNPEQKIVLNDSIFPIRDNLFQLLQQCLRRGQKQATEAELWWIDAVCIDQNNISERNQQVTLMRRIYRQAHRIVIWLGPAANDSDLAFEAIRAYMETAFMKRDPEKLAWFDTLPRSAIEKLKMRGWWERVWVWQEATTPHVYSEFWCGQSQVAFEDMVLTNEAIGILDTQPSDARMLYSPKLKAMRDLKRSREKYNDVNAVSQPDLYWLFQQATTLAATDPRDRIYALLPIWDEIEGKIANSVPVDYNTSPEQVFRIASAYILRTSPMTPRILQDCMCNTDGTFPSPSWAPDRSHEVRSRPWRIFVNYFAPNPVKPPPDFDPCITISDDLSRLTLRATHLGTVKRLAPRYSSSEHDLLKLDPPAWEAQYRTTMRELAEMAFPAHDDHPYIAGGLKSEAVDHLLTFNHKVKDQKSPPRWPMLEIANFQLSHLLNVRDIYENASRTFIFGIKYLRFFDTKEGYIGVAMPGVQIGDVLVGVPGIPTPLLLRKTEGLWRIVCCSFVVGLSNRASWGVDVETEEYCII